MKTRYLLIYIFLFIGLSTAICIRIADGGDSRAPEADATEINRFLLSIESNWADISSKDREYTEREGSFDYCIIDASSKVLILTREDMADTVSAATVHYDIIRDIEVDEKIVGKLIIYNPSEELKRKESRNYALMAAAMLSGTLLFIIIYAVYIEKRIISPFKKMKQFAVRIASGNLDTPLEMDRENIFGDFTEAFDIMREELKASRDREEAAVKSRKELVAELSHDIKTPVASIKAMADVMSLTAKDELERDTISAINGKADQIDKLISNLFHATLEELEQLEVHTEEVTSTELFQMLQEADYMKKISEIDIKNAVVISDPLRINQVISNIIANSYKYAGTDITVSSRFDTGNYYILEIADKGGGVPEEELEMITEKFKRGSNSEGKDGSGLGLYISRYLMEKMGGGLVCSNNIEGLTVTIMIPVA